MPVPPPYLVVIARGREEIWTHLERELSIWGRGLVELVWDRRGVERRWRPAVPSGERRHGERRRAGNPETHGLVIASRVEGTSSPWLRVGF